MSFLELDIPYSHYMLMLYGKVQTFTFFKIFVCSTDNENVF